MMVMLPTLPITDLLTKQPEVLNHLQESPITLTYRGHEVAVLVSPVQWHRQQIEIQQLRLLIEALQIKAKGEPTIPLAAVKRGTICRTRTFDGIVVYADE